MTTANTTKPAAKEMAGTSDPLLSKAMCERGHDIAGQIAALCQTYASELAKDGHTPGAEFFTKEAERWSNRRAKWYPTRESQIQELEARLSKLRASK